MSISERSAYFQMAESRGSEGEADAIINQRFRDREYQDAMAQ